VAKGLRGAGVAFADPSDAVDGTRNPLDPSWTVEDCQQRCEISTITHLENNVPSSLGKHAIDNASDYCHEKFPEGENRTHCYIEQLKSISEPYVADHTYEYSNCCKYLCSNRSEGTEACLNILHRPTVRPGTRLVDDEMTTQDVFVSWQDELPSSTG